VSHTYATATTFTVKLTATDGAGQAAVAITSAIISYSPVAVATTTIATFPAPQCAFGGVIINGVFFCNNPAFVTNTFVCPFFTVFTQNCIIPVPFVPVFNGNVQNSLIHGR